MSSSVTRLTLSPPLYIYAFSLTSFLSSLPKLIMAEQHYGQFQSRQHNPSPPRSHQMVKAATAVTAGGSLLVLSGLTLAATVIALTIATPLLVIFSPVLVPAALAVFALAGGFLASGGFGVAALSVLSWIYKYMTGKHPVGADQLDTARTKLAGKARDMKDRVDHNVSIAQSS